MYMMALVTDLQKNPHIYNQNGDKNVISTLLLTESSAEKHPASCFSAQMTNITSGRVGCQGFKVNSVSNLMAGQNKTWPCVCKVVFCTLHLLILNHFELRPSLFGQIHIFKKRYLSIRLDVWHSKLVTCVKTPILMNVTFTWMAANVSAVQMTYIMISFNFFTIRASQPYTVHTQTTHKLNYDYEGTENKLYLKTWQIRRWFYFLIEIFRMSEGPRAASNITFAAAYWYAIVFGFFIPVCILPVWVIVDPTTLKLWKQRLKINVYYSFGQNNSNRFTGAFCPHLSLNIVDGTALGVAVGAIVLVIHFLDGAIYFVFNLSMVKKREIAYLMTQFLELTMQRDCEHICSWWMVAAVQVGC